MVALVAGVVVVKLGLGRRCVKVLTCRCITTAGHEVVVVVVVAAVVVAVAKELGLSHGKYRFLMDYV